MRTPLLVLALATALALPAAAQTCNPGSRLFKNDILPDNPSGSLQFGIVPGVCENEAVMSVLNVGGPSKITAVSVLFGHRFGTNGVAAVVDVEIYDGATVAGNGRWTLGPRVFRLSDGSTNLQIQSTAINTFTLPTPVRVTSGKAVIGFRMLLTTAGGSCATGYDANFAVDAENTCRPGINVLDAIGHGPVDPVTYMGFGVPLCPLYIRGSWVIRACVEPEVSVTWTGNPTPGGVISLTYIAPNQGGDNYVAFVSGGIATGFPTPWGRLPLDPDPLFNCFLANCRALMINPQGRIGASGQAFGGMLIPNLSILVGSNLHLYVAFITYETDFFQWKTISAPSLPIIIN
jgi:hypothetical protein